MKTIQYQYVEKGIWDKFVEENSQACFWHTSTFLKTWPYGEDCSFAIASDDDEILCIWVLRKYSEIKIKKKFFGLYKKKKTCYFYNALGGYVLMDNIGHKQSNKIIEFYRAYIDDLMKKEHISTFSASLPSLATAYFPEVAPRVNPLLLWGFKNDLSQTYVVDLYKNDEDILHCCSETTRQEIKKIKNNPDYMVRVAEPTQQDLDIYYKLHCETYTRTGASPHPKSYFEHIFFDVMPLGINRILFMEKNGEVIAAQNSLFYKKVGLYWTGASVGEKDNGINKYLTYLQILHAKEIGCQYYEVGEAFPHLRSGKLKGLNDFKKSFGGFLYPIYNGTYVKG